MWVKKTEEEMKRFLKLPLIIKTALLIFLLAQISHSQTIKNTKLYTILENTFVLEITETDLGSLKTKNTLYFRLYTDGVAEYTTLIKTGKAPSDFKWVCQRKQISKKALEKFKQLMINKDFRKAKRRYEKLVFAVDDFSIVTIKSNLGNTKKKIELSGFFISLSHKHAHLYYPPSVISIVRLISDIRPKRNDTIIW